MDVRVFEQYILKGILKSNKYTREIKIKNNWSGKFSGPDQTVSASHHENKAI